jgi:hypothetical protein
MMSCLYSTFCPRRITPIVYFGEPWDIIASFPVRPEIASLLRLCLVSLSSPKCSAKAGTSLDHHLDRPSTTHIDTALPSLIHATYHYSTAALPYPTRFRLPRLFALPQEPVLLQSQQLLLGLYYVTGLATPSGFRASAP